LRSILARKSSDASRNRDAGVRAPLRRRTALAVVNHLAERAVSRGFRRALLADPTSHAVVIAEAATSDPDARRLLGHLDRARRAKG
jgi:hypothetical protein